MSAQPIVDAFAAHGTVPRSGRRVYLSPRGRRLDQRIVEDLAREPELWLLCGHYEGVDQRALDTCVDEEISIGDYILTGGELAAMVLVDCVARFIPVVLGSAESAEEESFAAGLLEYPQYTRPREWNGMEVPEVLLNGNHARIAAWRREQSLAATALHRPDLLEKAELSGKDRAFLERWQEERTDREAQERTESAGSSAEEG
jgi:tRNA (guanine37-N1)-methyltransferase